MRPKLIVLLAFTAIVLALAASMGGAAPLDVLQNMLVKPLSNPASISQVLERLAPLLVGGVGVFLALRGGMFNIGVEGQLMMGGITASVVALKVPGPVGAVLAIVCGAIAGAVWAWPAAWLKTKMGAHEVISTIMLNNIAVIVTSVLVSGPLIAPGGSYPATAFISDSSKLPAVLNANGIKLNLALIFALAGLMAFRYWLNSTRGGFELQAVGKNPTASRFAGIGAGKKQMSAMISSGAWCGLAGSILLLSSAFRFDGGFSVGYGYDSLGVALLAGASAVALIPSAALFAILSVGATQVQFLGVPKGITSIMLALLIIAFAAARVAENRRKISG